MMQVIITIRKEVADQAEADQLYNKIKQKADEVPSIVITGHTANHFKQEQTPQ